MRKMHHFWKAECHSVSSKMAFLWYRNYHSAWLCRVNCCSSFGCSEAHAKNQMVFIFTLAVLSAGLWKCIRWAQWDVWGEHLRFKTWGKSQAPEMKGHKLSEVSGWRRLWRLRYALFLLWCCGRNDGNREKVRVEGVCQDSWSEIDPWPQGFT